MDPIAMNSGLRYGDSMLPILFNIVLEKFNREIDIRNGKGVKLQKFSVGLLANAENLVLVEKSLNKPMLLFD